MCNVDSVVAKKDDHLRLKPGEGLHLDRYASRFSLSSKDVRLFITSWIDGGLGEENFLSIARLADMKHVDNQAILC